MTKMDKDYLCRSNSSTICSACDVHASDMVCMLHEMCTLDDFVICTIDSTY